MKTNGKKKKGGKKKKDPTKGGTQFSMKQHRAKDKASKAKTAKKMHDIRMRSQGLKEYATNYGKFEGETPAKKKKLTAKSKMQGY